MIISAFSFGFDWKHRGIFLFKNLNELIFRSDHILPDALLENLVAKLFFYKCNESVIGKQISSEQAGKILECVEHQQKNLQ